VQRHRAEKFDAFAKRAVVVFEGEVDPSKLNFVINSVTCAIISPYVLVPSGIVQLRM